MRKSHPARPGRAERHGAAVTVLIGTAIVVLSQLYAAIPLTSPASRSLEGDAGFALSTAFGISYAVGFVIWGGLSDHYGQRRVLLIGLTLLIATTLACTLASSLPLLTLLRATQGFTASNFAPAALAYLSQALPPTVRHAAVSAMSTAFLVAGIAGQIGAQVIAVALSWRAFFAISGVLLAGALLGVGLWVRAPRPHRHSASLGERFLTIARLATRRQVAWLCAAHVTLFLAFVALYSGLSDYAPTVGLSEQQTMLIRAAALPAMFTSLLAPRIARRRGLHATAIIGYVTSAAGSGIAATGSGMGAIFGVAVGSVVFVAGIALAASAMISLFAHESAPHTGAGMALQGLVLFLGASLGPIAAGLLPDYSALLLVLAVLLASASACVFFAGRTGNERGGFHG